jgi:ABC-type spermidine/putrescine transport system permease subunit II
MAKVWEGIYPYVFSTIAIVIILFGKWEIIDVKNFESILNATVTVSSIVIAFLGTMISILLTLTNAEVMKRIRVNGAHTTLTSYISQAIIGGLLLAVYSMVLFMLVGYTGILANILLAAFLGLVVFLFGSSFRIMYVISRVLTSVLNEKNSYNLDIEVVTPIVKTEK